MKHSSSVLLSKVLITLDSGMIGSNLTS